MCGGGIRACPVVEYGAVPDTRKGIQQQLKLLGEETSQSLMLAAYGLSLTDHYWMQPVSKELYWKNINFFENEFSDELGNLLTDFLLSPGVFCKWRDEKEMGDSRSYPFSYED